MEWKLDSGSDVSDSVGPSASVDECGFRQPPIEPIPTSPKERLKDCSPPGGTHQRKRDLSESDFEEDEHDAKKAKWTIEVSPPSFFGSSHSSDADGSSQQMESEGEAERYDRSVEKTRYTRAIHTKCL